MERGGCWVPWPEVCAWNFWSCLLPRRAPALMSYLCSDERRQWHLSTHDRTSFNGAKVRRCSPPSLSSINPLVRPHAVPLPPTPGPSTVPFLSVKLASLLSSVYESQSSCSQICRGQCRRRLDAHHALSQLLARLLHLLPFVPTYACIKYVRVM